MNAPMSTPRICHAEHMPGTVAQDAHVPVLIVGGGACGLTAALMLHDLGVDCAVLERDATPTGSSALSSGFIPAPGTQAQQAQGKRRRHFCTAADIGVRPSALRRGDTAPQTGSPCTSVRSDAPPSADKRPIGAGFMVQTPSYSVARGLLACIS